MVTLADITDPQCDDGLTCFLRAGRAILDRKLRLAGDFKSARAAEKAGGFAVVLFDMYRPGIVMIVLHLGTELSIEAAYEPDWITVSGSATAKRMTTLAEVTAALNDSVNAVAENLPGPPDMYRFTPLTRLSEVAPFLRSIVNAAGAGWKERSLEATH